MTAREAPQCICLSCGIKIVYGAIERGELQGSQHQAKTASLDMSVK